ncbi:MAG: NADPH-dependent F420 reductase [Roseiarcus sp.]|uniref:NADPH-dependent F420 reductase n=1 Tax=Roseiarcus sp. TaxID=1969460 RepID=UPI003BAFF3F8
MNIGVVGAGMIGGTVGVLWAKAGHRIRFGTRHPESLGPLLAEAAPNASAGSPEEAARFGEILFCSVPYGAWPSLAPALAPLVSGKVVLDSANPYPGRDGDFARAAIAAGEGAGVPVARLLPGARLVRAFNSVYFKTLQTEAHRAGDRVGIPLASNDAAALDVAARLVRDAGFEPVVVGPLARARSFDPGTPVYNTGMSGAELARALGVARSP